MKITQAALHDMFSYDPNEGIFRHRRTLRRGIEGSEPGEISENGYRRISAGGRRYRAHHLAWLYVYGSLPDPKMQIDHINGDKLDNRISNLRQVTPAQNRQNLRRANSNSTTGLLGVSRQRSKFRASIKTGGKNAILGLFDTPEAAHAAYLSAKAELHQFSTLGGI